MCLSGVNSLIYLFFSSLYISFCVPGGASLLKYVFTFTCHAHLISLSGQISHISPAYAPVLSPSLPHLHMLETHLFKYQSGKRELLVMELVPLLRTSLQQA